MGDAWHYTRDGKAMDPVSAAELRRQARTGLLKPTDLVWHEGMPDWRMASKTPGLFDDAPLSPTALAESNGKAQSPSPQPTSPQPVEMGPFGNRRFSNRPLDTSESDPSLLRTPGMSARGVAGAILGLAALVVAIIVGAILFVRGATSKHRAIVQVKPPVVKELVKQAPPVWPHNQGFAPVPHPAALGPPRTVPEDGLTIADSLVATDPPDVVRGHPCKVYPVEMIAGRTYTIDLMSKEFDAFLSVEDAGFKHLAHDDDSGEETNARLVFVAPETGTYRLIATSFGARPGRFTLRVRLDPN